jgi:hypothetical protein
MPALGTKPRHLVLTGMADNPDLDEELDRLQERVSHGAARVIRTVRSPKVAPYRIPVGLALTVGGVFGFMPVLGFWMLPLGLAVMAPDVPVMRRPTARMVAAINRKLKPQS